MSTLPYLAAPVAPNGVPNGAPNGAAGDTAGATGEAGATGGAGAAVLDRLAAARVVPIVRASTPARAETAVRWLHGAGLRCFEIAHTVPHASSLIRVLASDPTLLVGAGAVPDAGAARACLEAGARFVAVPWVDPALAGPCRWSGAALLLGAMTPTEVRAALAAGADAVRIFPAGSAGGPGHIRSLRGVFPDVAFCPAGGIEAGEVNAYLKAGARFVGLGGALVSERRIAAGDRAAILAVAERLL